MGKSNRLGKGLGALFNDENLNKIQDEVERIQYIDVYSIKPNKEQPRKFFNDDSLSELASSIQEHGIIQPIIVIPEKKGYKIVAGERRYRAAMQIGLKEVPCIVRDLDRLSILQQALIENIQRENLNVIEEAKAFDLLINECSITQLELAKVIGKSRPYITNTLRLLNLSEDLKQLVLNGDLTPGHARALLPITDEEKRSAIAQEVVDNDWSVRDVEKYIQKLQNPTITKEKPVDPNVVDIENQLVERLKTKVKIVNNKNKGKIVIEYFNQEELNRILDILVN